MNNITNTNFPLFNLGFRPLFLLAGLSSIIFIGIWSLILSNYLNINPYFDTLLWHQHEMLFGYTAAVIAGFLLTAAQNWTGVRGLHGSALFLLCALWLIARLMILFMPASLGWLIASIDILFFPMVAYYIARQVIKKKQFRNLVFIPILLFFAIGNGMIHMEMLGMAKTANQGISLGLWLCVILMTILGGRVIPFFTGNALPNLEIRQHKFIEILAIVSLLLTVIFNLLGNNILCSVFAMVAFIVHTIRLYGWRSIGTLNTPILWILHTGYAWIIIGLGLTALEPIININHSFASHAFAVGGIGCLTLGMMARVSLGHTGRPIIPAPIMTFAFIFINLAALFRIFGTMFLSSHINSMLQISAVCWLIAFTIFVYKYVPILISARADGKEG